MALRDFATQTAAGPITTPPTMALDVVAGDLIVGAWVYWAFQDLVSVQDGENTYARISPKITINNDQVEWYAAIAASTGTKNISGTFDDNTSNIFGIVFSYGGVVDADVLGSDGDTAGAISITTGPISIAAAAALLVSIVDGETDGRPFDLPAGWADVAGLRSNCIRVAVREVTAGSHSVTWDVTGALGQTVGAKIAGFEMPSGPPPPTTIGLGGVAPYQMPVQRRGPVLTLFS